MKLVVTNKAKGEVIFPSINYPVKAGHAIYVTREQFYANDIQTGLRLGHLYIEDDEGDNAKLEKRIEISNISGKPLGIGPVSLLVDESKFISEDESEHPFVKTAVAAGLVELIYPKEEEKTTSKKSKSAKASKKTSKKAKSQKKVQVEEEIEVEVASNEDKKARLKINEEKSKESKYKMKAWDAQSQSMLDKDEAADQVLTRKDSRAKTNPDDDVQVGDIDFTDKPEVEEAAPKKKIKLSISTKKGNKSSSSKSKGIKPVGRTRAQSSSGIELLNETELSFVDKEQTIERMRSRGLAGQNEEID